MSKNRISLSPASNGGRNINLDIIRIVAFIFVPGVHFFLHSGYYSNSIDNPRMVVMTFLRTLFLLCIPLFLMLTGYLQAGKKFEPCKKYYKKITKFVIPYLLVMTVDLIYIRYALKWEYTPRQYVENFTSFTHYSWYVEMYIGLFLLIPFLNMIWQSLKTRTQEHFLLATMIVITILPSFFNAYEFDAADGKWFSSANDSYWKLIPSWWTNFYPITYYFLGAYLSRHRGEFRMKPIFALLIFLGTWGAVGTYVTVRCWGNAGTIKSWTSYNSLGIFLMALTLFIFLNSFNFKKVPTAISKTLSKLSDLTFGAYLCSWMLDQYMYANQVNKMYPVYEDRFRLFIPAWLCAITCAFVLSFFVDLVYQAGIIIFTDNGKNKKAKNK